MNNGHVVHKTKMISVRLSELEFEFLKTQYQAYGARNVSDLARLAVQRMMQGPGASEFTDSMNAVVETLAALRSRVSTL